MLYATGLLIFGQICQKNIGFKFFFLSKPKEKNKKTGNVRHVSDNYVILMKTFRFN